MKKSKFNFLCFVIAMILFMGGSQSAFASAKDGSATVYVGSTTSISIGSAYQSTLRKSTGISYRWYSENTSYVTVTSSDKYSATIKGISPTPTGSPCRVYYSCSYYIDGFYRTMDFYYDITVMSSTVYVTSVDLDCNSATMYEGDNLSLTAKVYPYNATNKNVTWSSSSPSVASVSSSGYVTAKSEGSTTITCKASDGSGCSDKCYITVKAKTVYVTSVSVSPSSLTLEEGGTSQLSVSVYPTNATNRNVTWSSSNTSVATVTSSGYVTAKSAGNATITCKATDGSGKSGTCSVQVNAKNVKVSAISLNEKSKTLTEGETLQLKADVTPSNATNKNVNWSSSAPTVATVSSSGLVTAKSTGTTTITCKAADGSNKQATCEITVVKASTPSDPSISTSIEGKYKVSARVECWDDIYAISMSYPEHFDLEIKKCSEGYKMTSILGYDLEEFNDNGIVLKDKGNGKFMVEDVSDYIVTYNSSTGYLYAIYVIDQDTFEFKEDWNISVDNSGKLKIEDFFIVCFEYDPSDEIWHGNIEAYYYSIDCQKTADAPSDPTTPSDPNDPNTPSNPTDPNQPSNPGINSDYSLQAFDIKARSGNSVILPISMTNVKEVSGFQFNLSLPNGVTVTDANMTDRAPNHDVIYNYSDGVYKFSAISLKGKNITGKDGVVMNIELRVASSVEEGVYPVVLKNIQLFTETDELKVADNSSKLTVENFILGDVNGNGEVNTNDAIAIINYVIGKTQSVFIKEAADVNGNGDINTNDAIAIVNYVIGKTNMAPAQRCPSLRESILRDQLKKERIIINNVL